MEDVETLLADLARWTSDTRVENAARSRMRERWLRQQAEEDARFVGLALDLAETGISVAVRTATGGTLQGRIAAVASDFCVLRHDGGTATLLAFSAITTVRPERGYRAGEASSQRAAPVTASLAAVLVGLAVERPRVRIVVAGGGEALAGQLRSVGADVATMRLDGDAGGSVYVRLGSIREVTLLG